MVRSHGPQCQNFCTQDMVTLPICASSSSTLKWTDDTDMEGVDENIHVKHSSDPAQHANVNLIIFKPYYDYQGILIIHPRIPLARRSIFKPIWL